MIDIRFIQSMLARNKTVIAALEFNNRKYGPCATDKAKIAKLAAIQVALKAEISHQKWLSRSYNPNFVRNKKHGINDPRYTAFIQSCKD